MITNSNVTNQFVTLSFVEASNPLHAAAKIYDLSLQGQQGSVIQDVGFNIDATKNYQVTLEASAGTKAIVTDFSLEGVVIQDKGNAQLEKNNTSATNSDSTAITAVIDPDNSIVQEKTESTDGDATANDLIDGTSGTVNYLFGADGNDTLTGSSGTDVLNGGGGADTLLGGAGNDILVWDKTDISMNGGSNAGDTAEVINSNDDWDILRIDDGALALSIAGSANIANTLTSNVLVDLTGKTNISNIEIILITEEAGQSTTATDPNDDIGTTLKLNAADVLTYTDADNSLWVLGSPGDVLQLDAGGGWIDANPGVAGLQGVAQPADSQGQVFVKYTSSLNPTLSLYVESDVQVTTG
jgi:hypothetical protein